MMALLLYLIPSRVFLQMPNSLSLRSCSCLLRRHRHNILYELERTSTTALPSFHYLYLLCPWTGTGGIIESKGFTRNWNNMVSIYVNSSSVPKPYLPFSSSRPQPALLLYFTFHSQAKQSGKKARVSLMALVVLGASAQGAAPVT